MKKKFYLSIIIVIFIVSGATACSLRNGAKKEPVKSSTVSTAKNTQKQGEANPISTQNSVSVEKPVAAENNPAGDIPDSQVFVKYTSTAGGYELQVPEGWASTENGTDVSFTNKYDGVKVNLVNVTGPITLDSIKKNQVTDLEKTGRAVTVKSVKEAKLSGMQVFVVSYESNSDPNPVTNKQIRLENQNFYFYKDGKMAVVTVWAPLGADNVDQWNFMSNNFKWR
ncbi:hypothetical protein ACJDU8_23520 [Clostridium sp. WILCCON 0269]|uniref:PsbP C-terminal domain-containing protein n=1 Tax=Candidatus Clostridium eludens TaxID=3381663 RepID=A0ABW8STV6_9CLOT